MTYKTLFAVALTTLSVAGSTFAAPIRVAVPPATLVPIETAVTISDDPIVLVRDRGRYRQDYRRNDRYYSNRAPAYRNDYRPNTRGFYDRPYAYRSYRPYYYRPYYGGAYYGTPRFGYYNYGYLGGGVRIGPLQFWW
jgi:hypothetical protein